MIVLVPRNNHAHPRHDRKSLIPAESRTMRRPFLTPKGRTVVTGMLPSDSVFIDRVAVTHLAGTDAPLAIGDFDEKWFSTLRCGINNSSALLQRRALDCGNAWVQNVECNGSAFAFQCRQAFTGDPQRGVSHYRCCAATMPPHLCSFPVSSQRNHFEPASINFSASWFGPSNSHSGLISCH